MTQSRFVCFARKRVSGLLMSLIGALLAVPALAAGSNMPWEAPLQSILDSIQGPVARIVAVIIIVITGLTFPLGYWSRSVVPTILARTLASLPAPARRLKSLPRELDA